MMTEHLYVHVPFCKHICFYCDFCHTVYQESLVDQWLDALEIELKEKEVNPFQKTIYIGGGTPTSLSFLQLERLLILLDPYRSVCEEYTIEVNPETMTEEKCILLQKHGINRVSIGLQSSDDEMLRKIGREHTFQNVREVVMMFQKAGIENISLDIMYSLPGSSLQMLKKTIDDAIALQPKHLSLYSLTIEPNTVFERKNIQPLDLETETDMYEYICSELPKRGYQQYEISNFCIPGYESQHNIGYWHYDDFYGISCGASGKENHERYDNVSHVAKYLKNPLETEKIPLSLNDEKFEMIMMSLRLVEGLPISLYENRFHCSFKSDYGEKVQKQVMKGLLEYEGDFLKCTKKGFEILNDILVDLMD